jgi:hypothetical protein
MSQETVRIGLNRGFVAIIDKEDIELVSQFNWNAVLVRNVLYAYTAASARKPLAMHRLILRPARGVIVDHANGNGLDNRRCNLRIANHSQNAANKRKPQVGRATSTYKGVHWESAGSRKRRWRAMIRVNGRRIHLGSFATEVEAAIAYDNAAKEHFGEYARPNF